MLPIAPPGWRSVFKCQLVAISEASYDKRHCLRNSGDHVRFSRERVCQSAARKDANSHGLVRTATDCAGRLAPEGSLIGEETDGAQIGAESLAQGGA